MMGGVYLFQRGIAKTEPIHDAGAEVFQNDVGLLYQLQKDFLPLRAFEIQGHAELVAVEVEIIAAHAADEGRRIAAVISFSRLLDLDDGCAEVCKEHPAKGACQHTAQVQDGDVFQSACHCFRLLTHALSR